MSGDALSIRAIVCACYEVGIHQITAAIDAGADSVEAVGAAVRAGTNYGSCRTEIARILANHRLREAV